MAGKPLTQTLLDCKSLENFGEILQNHSSLLIEELWEGPKAALIWLAAQTTQKNILVLSPSTDDRLYDDVHFFSGKEPLDFPSWETLPGEQITPSPDLVGKRLETLHALLQAQGPQIVLAPLQAVLQKLPGKKELGALARTWKKGDSHPFTSIPELLNQLGYRKCPVVSDKGDYAIRGGIVDIFPLSSTDPYRIEFFGDEIDDIRTFDPISQKSIAKKEALFLPPASEISDQESSLLDYLGPKTLVIFNDLLAIEDKWVSLKKIISTHHPYFFTLEELLAQTQSLTHLFWTQQQMEELSPVQIEKKQGRAFYSGKKTVQPLSFQVLNHTFKSSRWLHPFLPVSDFFSLSENTAAATQEEVLHALQRHASSPLEVHFLSSSEAESNAFQEKLKQDQITLPKNVDYPIGYLSSGFVLEDPLLAIIPMAELNHRLKPRRQKWRSTTHTPASDFHELIPGDPVVHFHHGIAKFINLETRPNHVGAPTEFMVLEYAEGSKLFIPVSQSHLVSRYIGTKEETPSLSQLGSNRWLKTRDSAQKAILGYADQLLRMHAAREVHGGHLFPPTLPRSTSSNPIFPLSRRKTNSLPLAPSKETCSQKKRWIGSSAAMWAMERRKWQCAPPLKRSSMEKNKLPSSFPPPSLRCNTTKPFARAWPISPSPSASSPVLDPKRGQRDPQKSSRREDRHPHRHPQNHQQRRPLQKSRPHHHRRRAAVWRARKRTPQKNQNRRRLPHSLRHPHPPHPLHVARGRKRDLRHQYPPARQTPDQIDHCREGSFPDQKCPDARALPRWAGLFHPQPRRLHL